MVEFHKTRRFIKTIKADKIMVDFLVLECPHCGKGIKDEDAIYCSYCSKPLKELPIRKTGFPIAGGILEIIASCASVVIGIVYMAAFLSGSWSYWPVVRWNFLFAGLFGIVAFAVGLTGGIISLRREHFVLAIVGNCLIITGGFVDFLAMALEGYSNSWIGGLVFGFPLTVLSVLSLVFIAVSKSEFS